MTLNASYVRHISFLQNHFKMYKLINYHRFWFLIIKTILE